MIREEDVRPGDVLLGWWGGGWVVVEVRPYVGPFVDLGCLAVAETRPGSGITLWRGQYIEVANR